MSFQDIRGQDKPIRILREYIKHSSLGSSYLFTGPEGVGKNLTAKTLAKALNCQRGDSLVIDACDGCASCLKIENNQHPDVHLVDSSALFKAEAAASELIKIDYIRQLQKDINLKPYEGRRKVFIVNNAHNLTAEAGNALLKILEEPPQDSLIILVSAKPALLFKTIISRCRIVKFYPLERAKLEEVLKKDYSLDDNLAHFLAYFSEGRVGCALRLKDADILRQKNKIIDEFGLSRKEAFLNGLSAQNRESLSSCLNILTAWFRDIYFIKIGMPYCELINFDRKDQLLRDMNRYALFDLEEILKSISDSLFYLNQNVNIKLLLSNLKWSLAR